MTSDGWIPREQILGGEAESRVPAEFIVQFPDHANPPTFYFPLEEILERVRCIFIVFSEFFSKLQITFTFCWFVFPGWPLQF
jgi:hypothetical protein